MNGYFVFAAAPGSFPRSSCSGDAESTATVPPLLSKAESSLSITEGGSVASSASSEDDGNVPPCSTVHVQTAPRTSRGRHVSYYLLGLLGILLAMSAPMPIGTAATGGDTGPNSVYVSGGGFSGFWFTLGRLKSIPDPLKDYYCYSSGCLGVVATLGNYSMEEMYSIARDKQLRWQRGELDRYDVVEAFIDDLLLDPRRRSSGASSENHDAWGTAAMNNPVLLSKLNIITSEWGWFGVKASVRTPSDVRELRELLLQSTWIPYATGRHLHHKNHFDGAFSLLQHPRCAHKVGLAPDADLMLNFINVNLGEDKVEKFWNAGLAYGL